MNQNRRMHTPAINQENILTFLSTLKKSKYNLSQLYNAMQTEISKLNDMNHCYLTTYPYIGVHVLNRDSKYLMDNKNEIRDIVECALWEWQI